MCVQVASGGWTGSTGGEAVNIGTEQAVKGSAADSINTPAAPLLVHLQGHQYEKLMDASLKDK